MSEWSPAEKTVLGMILYFGGFVVVIVGISIFCFQRKIFELTGLAIPLHIPIAIAVVGGVITLVGDFLRRASRK